MIIYNLMGNAEGFRILTKLQYLGDLNGLNLTYATLSATLKYPNYECADKKMQILVSISTVYFLRNERF